MKEKKSKTKKLSNLLIRNITAQPQSQTHPRAITF